MRIAILGFHRERLAVERGGLVYLQMYFYFPVLVRMYFVMLIILFYLIVFSMGPVLINELLAVA